jgi:hypothetical protein
VSVSQVAGTSGASITCIPRIAPLMYRILGLHVSIIPGAIPRIHVFKSHILGWDSTVNWFNWTCYPKNMLNQLNQFPTATSTPGITGLTFLRIASPRVGKVPPCRLPTRGNAILWIHM